jgi:Rrf2 family protein
MKLSMRSDYALRALMTLVAHHGQKPISIREIAQQNDIPKRFLEHIVLELKACGWVTSLSGKHGGYVLAAAPEKITMGQVVRHFDGVVSPIGCVSISHYQKCTQEPKCRFRRVLLNIRNYNSRLMDQTDLAHVFRGEPVQHSEVFAPEFVSGEGI